MIRPPKSRFLAVGCLFAAILASCAGPSADRKKEADARMRMGVTYIEQRNIPMAMRELAKASELDPGNPDVEMALGLAYQARGDQSKAEEHLRRAIDKKPDYADARNNLGIVLAERKAWDEAIREFEAAAANVMYTTPERAYFNLGEAYRAKGDPARAEGAYRRALQANDRYAPAYTALSGVLGGQGKWNDAVSILTRCVEILPDYAPGWMELGRAYLRLSRPADAVKAFDKVLAVSSDPEERKQAAGYVRLLGSEKR
ncbi:MAG TPA: tetratricopeptide repeat protein [Candidatus Deferrimicrobium sp.]|nr:tetratricopeptide repeat protein [Candidatus Deferrimicrobium sp.]